MKERNAKIEKIRRINTHVLPMSKNKQIDWKASIGYELEFQYNHICGKIKLVDYISDSIYRYIIVSYLNKEYQYSPYSIKECMFAEMLKDNNQHFLYNKGDILIRKHSDIQILKPLQYKSNIKKYEYRCLKCCEINTKSENNLKNNEGCPVCCNQKLVVGINDLWTTHPELCRHMKNSKDGYKYAGFGKNNIVWVCPDCSSEFTQRLNSVKTNGFVCRACSSGFSFPNRFMFNLLSQLNLDFETEKYFDWCKFKYDGRIKRGAYDFVVSFGDKHLIIEMDGEHHKKESTLTNASLCELQFLDSEKDRLATEQGYAIVRIDCSEYVKKTIVNSILESDLSKFIDISNVDWDLCGIKSNKSLVTSVCNDYQNSDNVIDIAKKYKITYQTVLNYLKIGTNLGICNYFPYSRFGKSIMRPVICLTNEKKFNSLKEAQQECGCTYQSISDCCRGKSYYAGIDSCSGRRLVWSYYDDYLKLSKTEINEKIKRSELIDPHYILHNPIPIICLNNNLVFESISKALKYYKINSFVKLKKCLDGKIKSFGHDPVTNEPLCWAYA